MSFISISETFLQMQYMDSSQLINAMQFVEHQALENLRINSFREDCEAGKVQKKEKEKKQLSYLVLLFIVTFIL